MGSRTPVSWRTYFNLRSMPFWSVHVLAVITLASSGFLWWGLVGSAIVYSACMFFVTAGYHRYFAHRSYKTSRVFQLILAIGAQMTSQKGVIWWSERHRHHHRHSDSPEDVHSTKQFGFLYSHIGWFLGPDHKGTDLDKMRDLSRFPELRILNRESVGYIPGLLYTLGIYLIFGVPGLAYLCFLPLALCWHGTFTINSLMHTIGNRRYETKDESKNSFILAVLTHGEGWHNNHHHYQLSCRQGIRWYEIDFTYYVLRLLRLLGIVWDLKAPPEHVVEDRLNDKAAALQGTRPTFETFEGSSVGSSNSLSRGVGHTSSRSALAPGDEAL